MYNYKKYKLYNKMFKKVLIFALYISSVLAGRPLKNDVSDELRTCPPNTMSCGGGLWCCTPPQYCSGSYSCMETEDPT